MAFEHAKSGSRSRHSGARRPAPAPLVSASGSCSSTIASGVEQDDSPASQTELCRLLSLEEDAYFASKQAEPDATMAGAIAPSDCPVVSPLGPLSAAQVHAIFARMGFAPPLDVPLQEAFGAMMSLLRRQLRLRQLPSTPPRGRTAVRPMRGQARSVLKAFGGSMKRLEPCGVEVRGVNATRRLDPRLAGALEALMAEHGFVLLRGQGRSQSEQGIRGSYLTGAQQCELSLAFGPGALHSTHADHEECPHRDIFRLSNDDYHGFTGIGSEWHNEGSFCREVFSYVVYHVIKAPERACNTSFAHLGNAYDLLSPEQKERFARCASVSSNGGAVHPLVHAHPVSARRSLHLHTGMTGAIIERRKKTEGLLGGVGASTTQQDMDDLFESMTGVRAWKDDEMNALLESITELFDRPDVSISHEWREGDIILCDNLAVAVAHQFPDGAHHASSGLHILHRTTCKGMSPLDPDPELQFPTTINTARPCPFGDPDAVWAEGYFTFRWGDWQAHIAPR